MFENFVVSEIVKSYHNCGWEAYIYYFQDKDTKEIDILLADSGKLYIPWKSRRLPRLKSS